jgi:benzoate membrane transport protein
MDMATRITLASPTTLQSEPASQWYRSILGDFNSAAVWAGVTTFIWYAVGLVPVQIAVTGQFGLSPEAISSWIFIIWFTGAVASVAASLVYRQPIPITSTIPGLVFLGSLSGQFSYPELVGANLMAGVVILVCGITGVGGRILRWLPMPIAMGMLAGSILGDVSHLVTATASDMAVAGATIAGYAAGRYLRSSRIPPVGLALVTGGLAVLIAHRATPEPIAWTLPSLVVPSIQFSPAAFIAATIPLVVLSMGLGNVQGLGFLSAQGYKVPVNKITAVLGINSIVNALFGGHAAIVSRNGIPILAGPEAGPVQGRYWANIISALLSLLIALAAGPVVSLLGILPSAYIVTLAGLALLPSLQNAFEKSFDGKLRFGAVVAFVVSASSFTLIGIGSAFWALLIAVAASLLAEREDLFAHWRGSAEASPDARKDTPRAPVVAQATEAQYLSSGRARITTTIMDVSSGGLRVFASRQLEAGDRLALTLPNSDLRVRVKVRHASHIRNEPFDLWDAGCEFEDVSEADRERILQFVDANRVSADEEPEPIRELVASRAA